MLPGCASGAAGSAQPEPAAPQGPVPVVELAASEAEPADEPEDEAPTEPQRSHCGSGTLIDDGEDRDNQNQLGGYWFTYADGGSSIEPQPGALGGIFEMTEGGANGTEYAARVFGVVGNSEPRYAGMAFNFSDPKQPFDASGYDAVAFLAKTGEGATQTRVRVSFPDRNTDPDGGVCSECYNHFGIDLDLTPRWQPYEVSFAKLTQAPGWGNPRPDRVEPSELYGMQFQLSDGGAFEVWVDEVRLVRCGG